MKSVALWSAGGDLEADATVKSTNFILTGTSRNCSGGASPYGWLSCEETEEDGHGYVFLCDPFTSFTVCRGRFAGT
ncbi:alkaline phosphatase PhoX [Arenicellales bacterium IMCC57338]